MIKAEELLQIKDDSNIKCTLQMSNIHEITKNLKDRDISLYEDIFFSDEEEELLQVEQKNKDCDINFLIHKQEKVTSSSTKKNDYKNIINDETPSQNVTNISNLSLPKIILVDSTKNNGSIVNKVKSTNDKELQTEENFCIKESYDNTFEIESDENNESSSKELSIKCILPTQETIGINTNDPVITDDIQLNSNKELLKSNNLKEFSKTIQTSENIDADTNNGKEIPLENIKMDMCIAENQCLETVDKTICDKEPNIISKLQNMNWLKSRASFDVINMSHALKPTLKGLPKKDEQNKDYIPKYENSNNKHRSNDTIQNSNHNDISDSSKQNNAQRQTNAAPSKNSWEQKEVKN
ncbi:PREDICTED: myb-like protein F [Ceratosolen solmsi marchali]|uniref:Myb-like protein F n=1 Tax=Ceratosolen solmsi marchali TaxID=326594 RepID=A0AAJ6YQE4_9HYME|nr:PREDICTED: myb-like protein F [Ceratosolen solmsi marchali]